MAKIWQKYSKKSAKRHGKAISQNFAKLTFARVKKMNSVRLRIFYDFAHPFERKYYIYELYIPIEVHTFIVHTYLHIHMNVLLWTLMSRVPGALEGVRPVRPWSYLDFAKQNQVATAVACLCVMVFLAGLNSRQFLAMPLSAVKFLIQHCLDFILKICPILMKFYLKYCLHHQNCPMFQWTWSFVQKISTFD